MQKITAFFYIAYQEEMKFMRMYFLVKILMSGSKHRIELTFKKVYYCTVLEN